MAAVVIDLRHADDLRDVVHQMVQALTEGQIVAFPTETVYGLAASALDERGGAAGVGQGPQGEPPVDSGYQKRGRCPRLCPGHDAAGPTPCPPLLARPRDAGDG